MPKKILFLTTSHTYNDDRIFYHQALELKNQGFRVKIVSLNSAFVGELDDIEIEAYSILGKTIKDKIQTLVDIGIAYQPDCVICSEPLAVVAANKIKKKNSCSIIYDVTEWYPSHSMLVDIPNYKRPFLFLKFCGIQLWAGFLSSHFIFGEEDKQRPLTLFFPFKKKLILPYYPSTKYVVDSKHTLQDEIKLCFTGTISEEKGISNFFKVIEQLFSEHQLSFSVLLIGKPINAEEERIFNSYLSKFPNFKITIKEPTTFLEFSQSLAEADICFDLRDLNFENHHSLPIKLFYYMGSGKPVVYSKLKAIEKHLDVHQFGYLFDPKNTQEIVNCILNYTKNKDLYKQHAENARKLYLERYSWGEIRDSFVHFVTKSVEF